MKLLPAALAASLLLGSGIALADPGPGHLGGRHAMRQKLVERFDTNRNGQLEPAEKAEAERFLAARKAERQQKRIATFDQNRDGQLDTAELAAADAFRAQKKAERRQRRFAQLDQNGDGVISKAEFESAPGKRGPR
jgi:Ca2+-binding EF-hand superfamily protein